MLGSTKASRTLDLDLYWVWKAMRQRCNNPRANRYSRYGGRGIKVCQRWDDFEAFLYDIGPKPGSNYSIERIDNNGDYEPSNCRWATDKEQARNRRDTRILTYQGKTQCLKDHCKDLGFKYDLAKYRLRSGWAIKDVFTIPTNRGNRYGAN